MGEIIGGHDVRMLRSLIDELRMCFFGASKRLLKTFPEDLENCPSLPEIFMRESGTSPGSLESSPSALEKFVGGLEMFARWREIFVGGLEMIPADAEEYALGLEMFGSSASISRRPERLRFDREIAILI
jgi:hypothetical protein